MTKNINFSLGPAIGLTSRRLIITRMMRAGDDSAPAAEIDTTLGGGTETTTQVLPDNTMWQAQLIDTLTGGGVSRTDTLNFHTGTLQFPGPRSDDRLCICSMEDLSSSSSVSSSSVSSSSSSSVSSSTVSSQSTSPSSQSSVSTSSSSISASSSTNSSSSSPSSSSVSSSSSSSPSSSSISTSSLSSSSSRSSGSSGLN